MYVSKIVKLVSSSTCCTYFSNVYRLHHSSVTLKYSLSVIKRKTPYLLHNSFSTTSSPDDNYNVSKEKRTKKRRRILSSSDSSADECDKSQLEASNKQ